MNAEPLFAARSEYSERMYYHMLVSGRPRAAEKERERPLAGIGIAECVPALAVFFLFFMTFRSLELAARLGQSLIGTLVALALLFYMNKRRTDRSAYVSSEQRRAELEKNQARSMLENSGLRGVRYQASFFEECFRLENPGITTEYRYEGIAWIRETSRYYLLYLNRTMAVAVDKKGFYRGKAEPFAAFIGGKCDKRIETVRVAE